MAAFTNVVLADRASTPVNHTFAPAGSPAGVATFLETSATGSLDGVARLTVSLRKTQSGTYKVTQKLEVPVVVTETINGVTKNTVIGIDRSELTFSYSGDSTADRRKNIVGMTEKSLSATQTVLNDYFVNLLPAY